MKLAIFQINPTQPVPFNHQWLPESVGVPAETCDGFNGFEQVHTLGRVLFLYAKFAKKVLPAGAVAEEYARREAESSDVWAMMTSDERKEVARDAVYDRTPWTIRHGWCVLFPAARNEWYLVGVNTSADDTETVFRHLNRRIGDHSFTMFDVQSVMEAVNGTGNWSVVRGLSTDGDVLPEFQLANPVVWSASEYDMVLKSDVIWQSRAMAAARLGVGESEVVARTIGLIDEETGYHWKVGSPRWAVTLHQAAPDAVELPRLGLSGEDASGTMALWHQFLRSSVPNLMSLSVSEAVR